MTDWAVVIATAVGPIAAVGMTLWYQRREQTYSRRLAIFRSLMQWRRNWLHHEWVGALNLIPVEFSRHSEVISCFNSLIDKFEDRGFSGTPEERQRAYNSAETIFIELIQKIASKLSIKLEGFDLRARVYAPSGWAAEQDVIQSLRNETLQVIRGERAIKIEAALMPSTNLESDSLVTPA